MEQLNFDNGMRSFKLCGGVLRFNPTDPNVYARFAEGVQKLQELEQALEAQASQGSNRTLEALRSTDRQMKQVLGDIFGGENDFEVLLEGVNLLAVAGNGERVVTNLFAALEPILAEGAKCCADGKIREAVRKAEQRREAI